MYRMGRGRAILAALVISSLAPLEMGAAPADPPAPFRVQKMPGAEACPDAFTLAEATNGAMHRTALDAQPVEDEPQGVHIVVDFDHDDDGFHATIRVLGGDRAGERSLSDPGAKCDDLAQAVAITLAVMLDEGLGPPAPPPPAPSPLPIAPSTAVSPASVAAAEASANFTLAPRATPRALGLDVAVSGGALFGVVRSAAPYFALEFDATFARALRFGVGGVGVLPQQFDEVKGGFAEVSLLAAEAFACARVVSFGTNVDGDLCALVLAGGVRGRTEGLAVNDDRTRPWLAGGASARVDGRLAGPFGWTVLGAALAQRLRESFEVQGAGAVYEPAIVAFSLGFGLSASIW
jgi:hypothetical protein